VSCPSENLEKWPNFGQVLQITENTATHKKWVGSIINTPIRTYHGQKRLSPIFSRVPAESDVGAGREPWYLKQLSWYLIATDLLLGPHTIFTKSYFGGQTHSKWRLAQSSGWETYSRVWKWVGYQPGWKYFGGETYLLMLHCGLLQVSIITGSMSGNLN
jgi:hypothetical protein